MTALQSNGIFLALYFYDINDMMRPGCVIPTFSISRWISERLCMSVGWIVFVSELRFFYRSYVLLDNSNTNADVLALSPSAKWLHTNTNASVDEINHSKPNADADAFGCWYLKISILIYIITAAYIVILCKCLRKRTAQLVYVVFSHSTISNYRQWIAIKITDAIMTIANVYDVRKVKPLFWVLSDFHT